MVGSKWRSFIALFLICAACLSLAACHNKKDVGVANKEGGIGNSRVEDGKIYPYYDESLEMLVSYQSEDLKNVVLSDADKAEIVNKMDQCAAILCNDLPDGYDLEAADFFIDNTAEAIIDYVKANNNTTELLNCQIFNLHIASKDTVEATVIITGKTGSNDYIDLFYCAFERINSKWYISGKKRIEFGLASDYLINRDAISGNIVIADAPD